VASFEERTRYYSSHWARDEDEKRALDQYLSLVELPFNKTAIAQMISMTGDVSGKRVLDYGGGAGIMAILYAKAGAEIVLVDAEVNALRTARFFARREGVEEKIRVIHSETFPPELREESFDIVIAKDIIEHIRDGQEFLLDLSCSQQQGAILLLSTQSSFSLNYLLEGTYQKYWRGNSAWCGWDPTHLRFYTPASLRRQLEKAGYLVERWASVYLIPYNILSWFSLLKATIEIPALRYLDLTIGRIFPFNRFGWNVIVKATRKG